MPPKKKKAKKATARQKQSQTVIVNVGGKSKSGRGKLPPPSYQNNLTRIQPQQQIDYTPLLLSMMQQQSKVPIQAIPTPPINNIVPPIAPSAPATPRGLAEAGQTASNFQPMPSQADERLAQTVQQQADDDVSSAFKAKQFRGRSEPPPTADTRTVRGRIPKGLQVAEPYFEPGGGGGGAPIVTPSSVRPTLATGEAVGETKKPSKKITRGKNKKQYEDALKAAASK